MAGIDPALRGPVLPRRRPWHRHLGATRPLGRTLAIAKGMRTYDDEPYQWTLCSQCGSFGAEFRGYAERLSCGCLDDREHSKVAGGSDKRLLAAYPAAQLEQWHADDFTAAHAIVLLPTRARGPGPAVRRRGRRRELRRRVPVARRAAAPGAVSAGGWGQ